MKIIVAWQKLFIHNLHERGNASYIYIVNE